MSENNTDPDFHADPMKERMVAAPWHTALHFTGDELDIEMMAAYPEYDTLDPNEDSFFVRIDTLQVTEEGEAAATSVMWEVEKLAQFCRQTLALLHADNAIERARAAQEFEDDDDEGDGEGEGDGDGDGDADGAAADEAE